MKTNVRQDSIEIRIVGKEFSCDWGFFVNSEGDPNSRCGIQPLILVEPAYVEQLLKEGPKWGPRGGAHSAFVRDGRTFMRLDWQNKSWTWELFGAHWWDGDPFEIMVGRWSD